VNDFVWGSTPDLVVYQSVLANRIALNDAFLAVVE